MGAEDGVKDMDGSESVKSGTSGTTTHDGVTANDHLITLLQYENGGKPISQSNLSVSFGRLDLIVTVPTPSKSRIESDCTIQFSEKLKLTRNVFVISVGFMLVYSAFNAIQNLASTILQEKSLGVISLCCVYAFSIISCFLSPWLMTRLTPKWALVTAYILLLLFLASTLYPRMFTLIPASILWGLSVGPLWTTASLYVTTAGMNYGARVRGSVPGYISYFTGIWMMFQQMSQIIGNFISSLVLKLGRDVMYPEIVNACGIHYRTNSLNVTQNTSTSEPIDSALFTLGGIYLAFVVVAIVLSIVFLQHFQYCSSKMDYGSVVSVVEIMNEQGTMKSLPSKLTATLGLLKNERMYMLVPLSYMVGMQMVYLFADFTQAYVSCAMGVNYIGFTMIAFGAANTIGCYVGGRLYIFLGRPVLFTIAFILNVALYITLLLWEPKPEQIYVYFIIPAIWGLVDSILQPQTMAFLGYLFPVQQECAFANYNLFKNLGMAITYAYSGYMTMRSKLFLAMGISLFCMFTYFMLEAKVRDFLPKRKTGS